MMMIHEKAELINNDLPQWSTKVKKEILKICGQQTSIE
jgi:hypothetical protein